LNPEDDRATVLSALECVSAVCLFSEESALRFLKHAQPDIYVKGGDYTLDTMNQEERHAVQEGGGRVVLVGLVEGRSTTGLLEKIAQR
jgi:bifunctional ADP-heptose synthase (sugar kinase/adenylyltransferase)